MGLPSSGDPLRQRISYRGAKGNYPKNRSAKSAAGKITTAIKSKEMDILVGFRKRRASGKRKKRTKTRIKNKWKGVRQKSKDRSSLKLEARGAEGLTIQNRRR